MTGDIAMSYCWSKILMVGQFYEVKVSGRMEGSVPSVTTFDVRVK